MDKIILQEVRFLARVGCSDEERSRPQNIFVDVEAFLDLRAAGETDDLTKTACYETMHETMHGIVKERPWHLIEAIAESIAARLLGDFPFTKIVVRIRKPAALAHKDVLFPAVEITRERSG